MASTQQKLGATELLEREQQLRELAGLLEKARSGSGTIALAQGAAGIGKTSLLEAVADRARASDVHVLVARGGELEREFFFGVVHQLFEPALRELRPVERKRVLAGAAGLCAALFSDRPPDGTASLIDPGFATLHGLYWLLSNLSEQRPLLVVIDDVQWADSASLRFVEFLRRRIGDLPALVVLGARPRDPAAVSELLMSVASDPQTELLALEPLSERASATIVRARLGPDAEEAFCAACHEATGGNPFFLIALVDELAREGVAPLAGQAAEVRKLGPEPVTRSILLRLARLPAVATALASAVSVLGDGAEFRHAAALARLDSSHARAAADALTGAEILRPGERLSFSHPIVRAAVYSELGPRERGDAHARAARLLAGEAAASGRVAAHLLATDPLGDEWVLDELQRAARAAASRGALDTAASYLRRALREPLDAEQQATALLELARAELFTGLPQAVDHLTQSIGLSRSPATRVAAAGRIATALLMLNRGQDAIGIVDRVIAELPASERELRLGLEAELGAVAHLLAVMDVEIGERLERLEPELSGNSPAERRLLAMLAYHRARMLAPAAEAVALAERALAGDRLLNENSVESLPLFFACFILTAADRFEAAERTYGEIIETAQAQGSMFSFATASCLRAASAYGRGALDAALADAQLAVQTASQHRAPFLEHYTLHMLILILVERGELDSCEHELVAAGADGELPDTTASTCVLIARGRLRLAQGRLRAAVLDLETAGARAARWGPSILYGWRSEAALARHAVGEHERALELAEQEHEIARRWGAPRLLGRALTTLGLIEGSDHGIAHLHQALAVLEPSAARLEYARALISLGATLRRAAQPAEARAFLQTGLGVAEECRAVVLAKHAEDELAASGIRRHKRTLLAGPEALTPSELRIAEMAAGGRSNPEIAQALFVTRKTVEMHLGNAYRKLAINSREQLPQALDVQRKHTRQTP